MRKYEEMAIAETNIFLTAATSNLSVLPLSAKKCFILVSVVARAFLLWNSPPGGLAFPSGDLVLTIISVPLWVEFQ